MNETQNGTTKKTIKEYEIVFPGGWCYIAANNIVVNKKTGQRIFYLDDKIVGIIRLNSHGMLITGYNINDLE